MPELKYPSVGDPTASSESLRDAVISLKQGYEILTGMRGRKGLSVVTFDDLVRLGLIPKEKAPK